ncbi:MAG: phosphatidylserine decarboxylase family protein [Bacteroidetes bacterium]|nr:phosphatidylserine decarboxylase family protein [Bacteroidota bacterium]
MYIHKEGFKTIIIVAFGLALLNALSFLFLSDAVPYLSIIFLILSFIFLIFIISFFRIPIRTLTISDHEIICPADGKVVVIEEMIDQEYFLDKRIQVSIFMSPANVHVNRIPVTGEVKYKQYHKGKYLVAWHPKSSTENERCSAVIENNKGSILVKQIAGALAKRICNYVEKGSNVKQGEELGFIKFGSRVDVLLPLNAEIKVQINEKVLGGVTVLASW